jgi:hypothetical protein
VRSPNTSNFFVWGSIYRYLSNKIGLISIEVRELCESLSSFLPNRREDSNVGLTAEPFHVPLACVAVNAKPVYWLAFRHRLHRLWTVQCRPPHKLGLPERFGPGVGASPDSRYALAPALCADEQGLAGEPSRRPTGRSVRRMVWHCRLFCRIDSQESPKRLVFSSVGLQIAILPP